jgi:hypothetical protein
MLVIPFEPKFTNSLAFEVMVSDKLSVFIIIGAMLSVSAIVVSIICVIILQRRRSAEGKKVAL